MSIPDSNGAELMFFDMPEPPRCVDERHVFADIDGHSEAFITSGDYPACQVTYRFVNREFGGQLSDCSDSNVQCIRDQTGFEIAIPRGLSQLSFREMLEAQWETSAFRYRVADVDTKSGGDSNYITVERSNEDGVSGRFIFSRLCGLSAYTVTIQNISPYQSVDEALSTIDAAYREEARRSWDVTNTMNSVTCGLFADWWN